jgi:hypothetical protein
LRGDVFIRGEVVLLSLGLGIGMKLDDVISIRRLPEVARCLIGVACFAIFAVVVDFPLLELV